ncbi:MAG: serine hydrolase domain-containing protein [Gemmatimonadaceae bacterium]
MNVQVRSVIAFGCLLATARVSHAQRSDAPAGWADFVRTFDAYCQADSVVGASALVVRDGRVVAWHNRAMADRERAERVDSSTIFHWGSITKTLTAVSIMQLRDRGRLTLDDRVTNYLPELRQVHNPFGSMDGITIRMLLSHSAGFQDPTWPWDTGADWEPFEPTRWEQLVAMMPYQRIHFAPGSRYGYSNPAFIYLARIIEQLSGDPWSHYVQKNILTPLGLTRSYFGGTPYHLERHRSNNYTVRDDSSGRIRVTANGRDFDPGITIPNGGWNAPLGDLATYAAFLTNASLGDSSRARRFDVVLRRSSLEEMWRPVVPYGGSEGKSGDGMGLSFFIHPRGESTIIGHTGSQAGFRAFLYINPKTRDAMIAAYNTSNESRSAADAAALGILEQARTLLAQR